MTARFSVKNFGRFQHYKDRSPPWIKLYNELLEDYEFSCLQDASKLHLILIWLLASRSDNDLPFDAVWIRKRINASNPVDLEVLERAGFIIVDRGKTVTDQPLHGLAQVASNTLANGLQHARPEREGETETETESISVKFASFWAAVPRKVSKGQALKAYKIACKKADPEILLAGIERFAKSVAGKDPQYIAHPATWLNGERWLDQPDAANGKPKSPTSFL